MIHFKLFFAKEVSFGSRLSFLSFFLFCLQMFKCFHTIFVENTSFLRRTAFGLCQRLVGCALCGCVSRPFCCADLCVTPWLHCPSYRGSLRSVSVGLPTPFFFFRIFVILVLCLFLYVFFQTLSRSSVLSRHWVDVLQFHSILTPSAWRQRQTPQIKGSAPRDCLTSAQSQVRAVTWLAVSQGSHRPPPLSVSLLQPLTELRGTLIYGYSSLSWIQWKTQENRCVEGALEGSWAQELCPWGAWMPTRAAWMGASAGGEPFLCHPVPPV